METPLFGLYGGLVTYREDPEHRGRIKVHVPGVLEPAQADEGPWAMPRGGGAAQFGGLSVPPVGAAVYVQFLNGHVDQPVWEAGWYSLPLVGNQEVPERFPEHDHPDVHVWGVGPFRLVVDDRAGQRYAELKMVRLVGGVEETMGAVRLAYEANSIQVQAETIVELRAGGLVNVDAPVVQVLGRKVVANGRALD